MKNTFKLNKVAMLAVFSMVLILTSTVSVLAYTHLDFSKKANEWQTKNCTEKELNLPNANDKSAICYSIDGVNKNAIKIEAVKQTIEENSSNGSIYTLINSDVNTGSMSIGGNQTETIVPVDSVISNLTFLNKGGAQNVIEAGKVEISVLVNGKRVAFDTYLDNQHISNSASSNEIQVNAGDVIKIEINNSDDLYITGTREPDCWTYNGWQQCSPGSVPSLSLNIGLYLKAR